MHGSHCSAMTFDNRMGYRPIFGVLVPDFNSVVEPEPATMRVQASHGFVSRVNVTPMTGDP